MSPQGAAILVAAGSSTRMRASGAAGTARKPLMELAGRPLLEHACAPFAALDTVTEIIIVAHADDIAAIEALCADRLAFAKVTSVAPGGAERTDSVRIGCRAVQGAANVVAIHDAARPLVTKALVQNAIETAAREGSALPAIAVQDTLKSSSDGTHAERTVDRRGLFAAQTPQCFDRTRFLALLEEAERDGFRPTDDAALWERYVGPVTLVPGDPHNRKVTTQADLELLAALLVGRANPA